LSRAVIPPHFDRHPEFAWHPFFFRSFSRFLFFCETPLEGDSFSFFFSSRPRRFRTSSPSLFSPFPAGNSPAGTRTEYFFWSPIFRLQRVEFLSIVALPLSLPLTRSGQLDLVPLSSTAARKFGTSGRPCFFFLPARGQAVSFLLLTSLFSPHPARRNCREGPGWVLLVFS